MSEPTPHGEESDGPTDEAETPTAEALEAERAEQASAPPSGPPSIEALGEAKRAIEAIVLVATDPIPDQLLAQLLELSIPAVRRLCHELAADYQAENRGFQFADVAGGWRFQTHPEMAPYVERYVLEGQTARLSSAALETLAIVAYKQPMSRAQMSAIRGVNVDGVLRTLVQKGYVEEIGRDVGPGQATLFGTTSLFLERLGLSSLSDLPPLGEFVPDASVVEALEMTLRVAPDEPQLPLVTDAPTEAAPTEVADEMASGVTIIDLDAALIDAEEVDPEADLLHDIDEASEIDRPPEP